MSGGLGWSRPVSVVGTVIMVAVLTGCGMLGSKPVTTRIEPKPALNLIQPHVLTPIHDGDTAVSPGDPFQLRVDDGKLTDVALVTDGGDPVVGTLAPDGRSWQVNDPLGFGTTYHLQAEAVGLGGKTATNMSFTTLTPRLRTHPSLQPHDNEVVGIGQPVAVQFDEEIPDRRAVQDAIKVTTTPPVEGAFYWVNEREVRWRPEHFWAAGTHVTINMQGYGRDFGNGVYGDSDLHSSFSVGEATIFTADDNTKNVVVERDGQVIRSMATSMGKSSTPTENGVYILGDRFTQIIMDSSTYGVPVNSEAGYRTPVDWATRMSYSGVFMHSAPWSVGAQGAYNTSHGCLNLSPDDARWVYENAKRGDIAIVKNTQGGQLSGTDGLGDWNVPWPEWKTGNADSR